MGLSEANKPLGFYFFKSVQSKFSEPEEIDYWIETIKSGLSNSEKSMVDRHFDKPGFVLDVGCGAGREALALTERGPSVVAMDITPEMVKNAQKNKFAYECGFYYWRRNWTTL